MRSLFYSRVAAFQRDTRGNVAMIFGLSAIPAMLMIAGSIDYSHYNSRQTSIHSAIDGAVLSALAQAGGGTPNDTETRNLITAAIARYSDIILSQGTGSTVSDSGVTTIRGSNGSTCSYSGTVTSQTSTCANTTLTYTAASGSTPASYQATIVGNYSNMLGSLFANASFTVTSTADVSMSEAPSSTQFKLTQASGGNAKTVKVYIHNKGAASDTMLASYTYVPNNLTQSNSFTGGVGIGTVTASFQDGTTAVWDSSGNVLSGTNKAVSLGTTYDNAYLTMDVYNDGCPAGQTPDPRVSNSSFACLDSGTTFTSSRNSTSQFANNTGNASVTNTASSTSTTTGTCGSRWSEDDDSCQQTTTTYTYTWTVTKQATVVTYSTADPTAANHLFVMSSNRASTSADDMPLGTSQPISLFTMIPCGKTVYHSWEDTPWSASQAYGGSWSAQDIYFQVTGTTCAVNANYTNGASGGFPYLTK